MTNNDPGEAGGQSEAAKLWKARREAADRAIAASEARLQKERAVEIRHVERAQAATNPMVIIIGLVVAFVVLGLLLWFFISQLECDPMMQGLGSAAQCRRTLQ